MSSSKARQLSKIEIGNSGCHTLIVNFATQSILQIGYSNNIKVWECDNLTYELMPMGELVGHRAIIVSATNVGLSSIVVTGDDKGYIKLWDLKYIRCYQTLRLSTKEICQLINIEDKLVYGDNRISFLSFDAKKGERS